MACLRTLLQEHGLDPEHHVIFTQEGYHRVEDLVGLDEDQGDDLRDALVANGADRVASRKLVRSLRQSVAQPIAQPMAQRNEAYLHFYGLMEKLNRTDFSGLDEATILKIDIDPLDEQLDRVHVPARVVWRMTQTSSTDPVPVIAVLGPTGSGKSFLVSTFMQSSDGNLPLVASPDQHVPTSAHVCVHKGAIHSGSTRARAAVLLDFEGEDGRVPKTLLEVGMRKLNVLRMTGLTEDALQQQMETTITRRQQVIKDRLPPLAYLLCDVVVFIDTVEPRRTERVDRIRRFATQAHQAVNSLGWMPALILVQNKWVKESDSAAFNVNSELGWLLEDLKATFSSVTVLRVAHSTQHNVFEASLNEMHNELLQMVEKVHQFRQEQGVLYTERDFWFNFKSMVRQPLKGTLHSLEHFVSRNRISTDAAENAWWAFEKFPAAAGTPASDHFCQTVSDVLKWYAYSRAGEARRDGIGVEAFRHNLRATFDQVMSCLQKQEPCAGKLEHDDGKTYCCTQLRTGHQNMHRNPALIPVESKNFLKRFFLWKDWKPCIWTGDFENQPVTGYADFEKAFRDYLMQDVTTYLNDFPFATSFKDRQRQYLRESMVQSPVCWLCLCASSDQVKLQNDYCRHSFCRKCVVTRVMLLGPENKVIVCPFCKQKADVAFHSQQDGQGFRLLSLDGGGIRGIIEVLVLKHLEEVFAPLRITSLFDLIIGTSAGGLISMALLHGIPLSHLESLLQEMSEQIFSVNPLQHAYRFLTGSPLCNTEEFERMLKKLFSNASTEQHRGENPPFAFCVAFDSCAEEHVVLGNYPNYFEGSAGLRTVLPLLWEAARWTTAAPGFFDPGFVKFDRVTKRPNGFEEKYEVLRELVDGGVVANCPAGVGVKVAAELLSTTKGYDDIVVECIASLGTGLRKPSVALTEMNALSWAKKLIDMATDSERLWREHIEQVPELRSVPRVRVNPPDLGSLDAFGSDSIPKLLDGMEEYFASDLGKEQVGKLIHMTYAKLWEVNQAEGLVAGGSEVKFSIVMQDPRCDFGSMKKEELKNIIVKRNRGVTVAQLEGHSKEQLLDLAREAFQRQPFVFDFQGCFGYRFAGSEHELSSGQTEFGLAHSRPGAPELDVFWRSVHGDISVCGCPRVVRVNGTSEPPTDLENLD